MKKENNSVLKVGIITGVISSFIFTYLADPITKLAGKVASGFLNTISSTISDRFYTELATGIPDFTLYYLAILLYYPLSILFGFIAYFLFRKKFQHNFDLKAILKASLVAATVVASVMILFLVIDGHLRLKIETSFKQHKTILSPHVTDQTIKELDAEFASMKSKTDFIKLQNHIQSIAGSLKVTLPENKLYPY